MCICSELFSGCQEDVLYTLALEFSDLGQILLKSLLVNPGRASRTPAVSSSSVQLIFKLAKSSGDAAGQRFVVSSTFPGNLSPFSPPIYDSRSRSYIYVFSHLINYLLILLILSMAHFEVALFMN